MAAESKRAVVLSALRRLLFHAMQFRFGKLDVNYCPPRRLSRKAHAHGRRRYARSHWE